MIKKLKFTICIAIFFSALIFAQNEQRPKNIIVLIGDGMGIGAVSSDIYQNPNSPFLKFKSIGLSITKSANKLVTDSGAGGTAISTGVRTNNHMIGVDSTGAELETILELAQKIGKATGIVATSSITHATPASFTAHIESRKEEYSIADQLVENPPTVAIGGGMKFFTPQYLGGARPDSINLIDILKEKNIDVITDLGELKETSLTTYFGILAQNELPKAGSRNYNLGELTEIAINTLSKEPNGFFLMVEGSQIDWGEHANDQEYAMGEISDFVKSVETALKFAIEDGGTLLIVTADHETGGTSIVDGTVDGSEIKLGFSTKNHTADLVPIFAYGPGEEHFKGIIGNYEIGKLMFKLFGN